MTPSRRTVLVTGCSSGIGRATALLFLRRGWEVIATARHVEALAELESAGCEVVALDVTDESSMLKALEFVRAGAGRIDVLVNNAGYGLYGPVEQLEMDEIRRQFETNVFGLIRLTQLVLPMMRARREGCIINVSSIAGRMSLPTGGAYHGSKHAVEAVSDALRYEVSPQGIRVCVVEPGPVRTPWAATASSSVVLDTGPDDPYGDIKLAVVRGLGDMTTGIAGWFASSPESVARKIFVAANASRPKSRYRVGPFAKLLLVLRWALPDSVFDRLVSRTFVSSR